MIEPKLGHLAEVAATVRLLLQDWEAFVTSVEALAREHEALQERAQETERAHAEAQAAGERLRHELESTRRRLADLQAQHEQLRREQAAQVELTQSLRGQLEHLRREREAAAEQLEDFARRLKS